MLVPINRKYPLSELLAACRHYVAGLGERRALTVEYTLIKGVNDSLAQARALARLLRGLRCKINLIPFTPSRRRASSARAPARCGLSNRAAGRRLRGHAAHHAGGRHRRRLRQLTAQSATDQASVPLSCPRASGSGKLVVAEASEGPGAALQAAREARELSVPQVADQLKLSSAAVTALEANDWDRCPRRCSCADTSAPTPG